MSDGADPASDKAELRRRMAAVRAAAHAAQPGAPAALIGRFPHTRLPAPGAVAACYWPMGSEIDPRPLMAWLAGRGVRLALPVAPPRGAAAPLAFRLYTPETALVRGHFRVPEPPGTAPEAQPSLVLAPLLAFDRSGARLGQGAGHYDRTLAALRAQGQVTAIGLAFAEQEVGRVPTGAHDQKLDGVLTPDAYIPAS